MKQIFAIAAVVMCAACTSTPKEETNISSVFIEQKVQDFIKDNPDWSKDEVIKESTTDRFKREIIRWSNEPHFLDQMPLQLQSLKDTTVSGANIKLALFTGYNDTTRPMNSLLNYIQIRINALVAPDLAKKLQLKKNYTIQASLYKQGKRADIKYISVADFKGYDLGTYLFSLSTVKPKQ